MSKSFKELLENYNEFMEILQSKVKILCEKTHRYNAFQDVDNYSIIKVLEEKIYIDVMEGEDYFEYNIPFYEITLNEDDKLLFELKLQKTKYECDLHKERSKLIQYNENLKKFIDLSNTYGNNTQYDVEKVKLTQVELENVIKSLELTIQEINNKIEKLICH